ncbi:MAG: hypothetical protein OIF50_07935 [Flavobacteriaceae bacterium]|nr:hypothetical protein [Flavobacteriaceae bacterium]
MAIIKQAKNIIIKVDNKHIAVTKGKFIHMADSIHIESYTQDLKIHSNKASYIRGNQKIERDE